ncbi:MAG TPA: universal stress protein [Pseudonocardia sp.]|jgi:nucleotide-binding universal stress UspA family protein|uniref:universal stress protein n=1 Tax=Pseudonocardia sp. TaxID=60912 RepID=UPI002B4B577E|nr:universal stress protein [Pseudonocardia sp.]HLU55933.1 universal stress protein [Pseudonocardia sp.]
MQPDAPGSSSSKPILVAYDGSRSARAAASWAAAEAAASGRSLWLVHVIRWPLPELDGLRLPATVRDGDHARRAAAQLVDSGVERCRQVAPGVDVRGDALTGGAIDSLGRLAEEASLLVLGASGQTATRRVLLGSSAAELTRRVTTPVVVIREPATATPASPVLIGVDGSAVSDRVVDAGFAFAARRGLGVVAVHAWCDLPLEALGGPDDQEPARCDATALLADRLAGARARNPQVRVEEVVTLDRPASALLDRAAGAALLVVGRHGRGRSTDMPLGSVCHAVLYYAACPVLLAG